MKWIVPCLGLLASCAGSDLGQEEYAIAAHSAESVGVIRLLNDAATTFAVLDVDARLDRRAAANLIAARNGPDGVFGTEDDIRFQTISDVDDVRYVGPSALSKLSAYSDSHGYRPGDDELLGEFDGVPFSFGQAERALLLVNEAEESHLDDDLGLDSRAVRSILAARPIATMGELASLYYVGSSALQRIAEATTLSGPIAVDCQTRSECGADEFCQGIPFDGSSDLGICRPRGNVPGAGNDCSVANPCGPELFCGGLSMGDLGLCLASWQQDTFENTDYLALPGMGTVANSVVVRGQASVPFDITVEIDLQHSNPEDLRITLLDPSGTDAILWDGPTESSAFPGAFIARGRISRDDVVNGRWQLVTENLANSTGSISRWTLWLSSNFD